MPTTTAGPAADVPEADRPFHIEQHGIDFIPLTERWARPRDLFGMWAGASAQVEYFVYGAILMTFGFTFAQAVSLVVIGNLSYVLLGLCSLQGPVAGTTVFGVNRASYGPNGSRLIALFNWLTQIGFEAEGLILIVGAALAISTRAGLHPGTPAKALFIVGAVAVQVVLPFLGHATMVRTLRVLVAPSLVLYAVLLGYSAGHVQVHAVHPGAGWQLYLVGLAFTIALSGLGWAENGNDYSRYLPPAASKPAIVGWVFLGTAVPEILVMTLGAAVATFVDAQGRYWNAANPFSAFQHQGVLPGALVVAFLGFAIVQIFAINSLDLYSSGVTLQALGVRIKRYQAVLVDSVICLGITFYAVFDAHFSTLLKDFVAAVIAWIAPWVAIFLADWLLRRRRYAPAHLQRTDHSSLYWSSGGVSWPAVVAQAAGTVAAVLGFDQPFYVGPLAKLGGGAGSDYSIYAGMVVAAAAYLVLATARVRRQAAEQDRLAAAEAAA